MILIALGTNLPSRFGTPEDTLKAARLEVARRGVRVLQCSDVWLTAPVPVSDQPWYRNAVMVVETDLAPRALLKLLKEIERDFGRDSAERNASRVLDLDILAYGDVVLNDEVCCLPHPRLHERAFVLYPLREVAAEWRHPVLGLCVEAMIERLPTGQAIEKLEGRVA